jgi:hypothetical protein
MPTFAQIHLEFDELTKDPNYPRNDKLPSFMTVYLKNADDWARAAKKKEWLLSHAGATDADFDAANKRGDKDAQFAKNTSCCMQVSNAFNTTPVKQPTNVYHRIPASSFWRANPQFSGGNGYYIQAVNELANYLTTKYGGTDQATKPDLAGKKGILTFGGQHTEFWDGADILQKGLMDQTFMTQAWGKRVLFWEINGLLGGLLVPPWLEGWWTVSDGGKPLYYYYFSSQAVVTYVSTKPNPNFLPNPNDIKNEGKVTTTIKGQSILGFVIDWKPDPQTHATAKETLTWDGTSQTSMTSGWNLKSNAVATLALTKGVR